MKSLFALAKNAAHCDRQCSALHWATRRTAFFVPLPWWKHCTWPNAVKCSVTSNVQAGFSAFLLQLGNPSLRDEIARECPSVGGRKWYESSFMGDFVWHAGGEGLAGGVPCLGGGKSNGRQALMACLPLGYCSCARHGPRMWGLWITACRCCPARPQSCGCTSSSCSRGQASGTGGDRSQRDAPQSACG